MTVTAMFLAALISVESGGRQNAIGDGGHAFGVLQIHANVVIDVNRNCGTRYTHRDAFDPEKAKEICRYYLEHYITRVRLGRPPTNEDFARIWNGGPDGWKSRKTDEYWRKVHARLLATQKISLN